MLQQHALVSLSSGLYQCLTKDFLIVFCLGTGEQMAHTLIASKAVDRMFHSDDESQGLKTSIEKDFMGLLNPIAQPPSSIGNLI